MFKDFDPLAWLRLLSEIATVAVSVGTGLMLWHRKHSARHWPMTYGRIETALALDENNYWFSDLFYSYKVGTGFYSGHFRLSARMKRKPISRLRSGEGKI